MRGRRSTIASRRGAIPIDEALGIAKQIAEALEAAHERGIVHRDLKPANVKVRADGAVKVLDFGIAKAMEPVAGSSPSVSMSPTITTPAMTRAGMILGTAAYMAPEQARGNTVDRRADIWAFGCVLYEMLTGRRAFDGTSAVEVISDVLKTDPEWAALPAETPTVVRSLLRRCLQKDPSRRLRDAADARFQIEDALSDSGDAAPGRTTAFSAPARRTWWVAAVIIASAAAVAVSLWSSRRPAPDPEEVRFEIQCAADDGADLDRAVTGRENARVRSDNQQAVAAVGAAIECGVGKTVGGNGKREASHSGRPTAGPSDLRQMLSSSASTSRAVRCASWLPAGHSVAPGTVTGQSCSIGPLVLRCSASPPRAANRVQ